MPDWFATMDPVLQSLLAGGFTWGLTALGAALVFFTRSVQTKLLEGMMGFAAGVMIAASFWSLLAPAIEIASHRELPSWIPAVGGFLVGGAFLRLTDAVLPHLHPSLHPDRAEEDPEGLATRWRRTTLLVLAITLHNLPEGLAVGVAFGAAAAAGPATVPGAASLGAAVALAVGIGLQNFPEGVAVAMPLRREGVSAGRSFWYGQLSAVVEPMAAVAGAAAVGLFEQILPYALSFAAGAMIYVVVEELIPEAHSEDRHSDVATVGAMLGFAVMMTLDVALG